MIKDTSPSGQNRERPRKGEAYAGNVRDFLLKIKELGVGIEIVKTDDIPICIVGNESALDQHALQLLVKIYHAFRFPIDTYEGRCVRYAIDSLPFGFSGILGTDQKEANYIFGSNHAIAYLQTEAGFAAVDWTLCYIFSRVNCGIEMAVFTAPTLPELQQLVTKIYGGEWAKMTPEYVNLTAQILALEDREKNGRLDRVSAERQAEKLLDKRNSFPKYQENDDRNR